jgi:anti-anti-sigma regulatory factor
MLRITRESEPDGSAVVLRLEGRISGPWVEELRRTCDRDLLLPGRNGRGFVLEMSEVSFIDAEGVALLRDLTARRVSFANCSAFVAEQLKEVADDDR